MQRRTVDAPAAFAVQPVAEQRKSRVRHMHAQLMCPSRVRGEPHKRDVVKGAQNLAFAACRRAVRTDRVLILRTLRKADRRVDHKPRLLRHAADDRKIRFPERSFVLDRLHPCMHIAAFGNRQKPRRALVETADRMRVVRALQIRRKRVFKRRRLWIAVGMHADPLRLIEHQKPFVLIHDRKRHRDRTDRQLNRISRIKGHDVARPDRVRRIDRFAVFKQRARSALQSPKIRFGDRKRILQHVCDRIAFFLFRNRFR